MNAIKLICILILLPLTVVTFAQDAFEGKVVFNLEEQGKNSVMDYYAKDKKFRMEIPDKGGTVLFDSNKLKMYVIMDEQKMYMETDMLPMSMSGAGSVTKTGETKNILGHECEKFIFDQKDLKGEAWMTKDLGAFMFFMESQQDMPAWQSEILDAGYFPLQITQYNKREDKKSVYTVIKVTPMDLSDDLFVPPPAYQKFDMMNLGNFKNFLGK